MACLGKQVVRLLLQYQRCVANCEQLITLPSDDGSFPLPHQWGVAEDEYSASSYRSFGDQPKRDSLGPDDEAARSSAGMCHRTAGYRFRDSGIYGISEARALLLVIPNGLAND